MTGNKKKSKGGSKEIKIEKDLVSKLSNEIVEELSGKDGKAQMLGSNELGIKIRGVIPTSVPGIDLAIGRGGIPRSRLTILHGFEGSGKTTLALHVVAQCQRMGGIVVYMDKEYKLDPDYAKKVGVDIDRLIVKQPGSLEDIYEAIQGIIHVVATKKEKKKPPILIVLDSLNAAVSKSMISADLDKAAVGSIARVHSKALPIVLPEVSKHDITLLFISQMRTKIGVLFGDPAEIAGGHALKHYASLIIRVDSLTGKKEKEKGEFISNAVKIRCTKNQIALPFKTAECRIIYGKGFDRSHSLFQASLDSGVIEEKGTWYYWRGEKIVRGAKAMIKAIRQDFYKDLYEDLKELK